MKKLLNVGVDLTLQQRGKMKRHWRNERQILRTLATYDRFSPVNISTQTSTNSFLDSMHSPRSRGCILMEIYLSADLALFYAVGGICVYGVSAAIFPGLEFAGLLYIMRFAGQVQATPHSNLAALHPSVASE